MAFITQKMWLLSILFFFILAFISKRTKGKLSISWLNSNSPGDTPMCLLFWGGGGRAPEPLCCCLCLPAFSFAMPECAAVCGMSESTWSAWLSHRKHHLPCFQEPWSRVPHRSPQETELLSGRTRIPGPQMMADRIKRPIEGTFQGTCLLRERAKWKRSEHF